MSHGSLLCWKCFTPLHKVAKPFPRLEACRNCGVDLHVCRLCRHYAPQYPTNCGHDTAEPARDAETANFCHFFAPVRVAEIDSEQASAATAHADLNTLFSGNNSQAESLSDAVPNALEDLFDDKLDD